MVLGAARTLNGTLTLQTGTFNNSSYVLTLASGASIVREAGSLTAAPTFAGTVNVTYAGTSAMTTGFELPSSTSALAALTIDDGAGVSLATNETVNGLFTLESGNLATGSNTLSIGSTGSVSQISGYVIGNMEEYAATGATTLLFPIGTANGYNPATVSFANVTTGGNLIAVVGTGNSASIGSSGLDSNHSVYDNWTLAIPSSGGLAFSGSYSATFGFSSGDVESGRRWAPKGTPGSLECTFPRSAQRIPATSGRRGFEPDCRGRERVTRYQGELVGKREAREAFVERRSAMPTP